MRTRPIEFYINQAFASVFIVNFNQLSFILSPAVLFICLYVSYDRLIDSEDIEYYLKYSSLFYEFKNDKGLKSSLFYVIYFFRRIIYVLSLRYLNSMILLQKSINAFCSLICLTYLTFLRPFKSRLVLITNLINEIAILILFCLNLLLSFATKTHQIDFLEKTFIYTAVGSMGLQSLISFIGFLIYIKKKCSRPNKKKRMIPASGSILR